MSDNDTTQDTAVSETSSDSGADTATESETVTEGQQALGDAGKKALDAMKAERNEARELLKGLRSEFDAFRAQAEGKAAEHAAAVEAQRVQDEALAKANERILRANLLAEAKGKLTDPSDVFAYINDLSSFEVSDDGEVDAEALASAIDDLIARKPYLAAQGGKRFQGSADGGARNDAGKPSQLTEADVQRLYAEKRYEEIEQARLDGRLNTILGIPS